jgi:hypothetical protein
LSIATTTQFPHDNKNRHAQENQQIKNKKKIKINCQCEGLCYPMHMDHNKSCQTWVDLPGQARARAHDLFFFIKKIDE